MSKHYGVISTPGAGMVALGIQEGRWWACDNGAFKGFDESLFLGHLEKLYTYQSKCLFIVAPDVVGDARATLARYPEWHQRLKVDCWSVAFVAQDGQEDLELPEMDWLFIGGSTNWKMGSRARECIQRAHDRQIPVHIGRVNSWMRYEYFKSLGARSCDGTHPIYEPDKANERISGWMERPHNLSIFIRDHSS